MAEVEIGIGKSARRAYSFSDIAIVPSRRTRDAQDVDVRWDFDAYEFGLPILGACTDSVTSPATAIELGRLGGAGVLNLEGLWTRYEDPAPLLEEIAGLDDAVATARMQEIYAEPIRPELVTKRIREVKDAGVLACASLTPQRVEQYAAHVLEADLDLFVISGTVVSAEHVSQTVEPLNLKRFIREFEIPVVVGGCASYQAALHLMRSGAVGVLVGVRGVPQATAVVDAAAARMRHLVETGVYVHVIANGGMSTADDIAKAVACGADGVMLDTPLAAAAEAPGRGYSWTPVTPHPTLPRGAREFVGTAGSLEAIIAGPATAADGRLNLTGGLRAWMASTGHDNLREFQKADLVVLH